MLSQLTFLVLLVDIGGALGALSNGWLEESA